MFEAADRAGGLAAPAAIGSFRWDRFYHVILLSDLHTRGLLDELGLAEFGRVARMNVLDGLAVVAVQVDAYDGVVELRVGRLHEVVDVTDVIRRRLTRRLLGDEAADHRVLPRSGRAKGEEIVALTPDPDTEQHRLDCPLLPDHLAHLIEIGGRAK